MWWPVLRHKRMDNWELCLANSAFTLAGGISLLSFYYEDKLDVLRCGYSSGFYTGILLFVLIEVAGSGRRLRALREQALKAAFFRQRAYTDDLTGLLSIKGFDDECAALLTQPPAQGMEWYLLDFDVNFFSQYNANHGPDAGDALLRRVADTLKRQCGEGELCARQEADHFVCLLLGQSPEAVTARVREADQAVRARLTAHQLLLSYGVVQVTDRRVSVPELRNQAVVAKRYVKGNYEWNVAVYDRDLHDRQLKEQALLSGFETALEKGAYTVYFQPKICVDTQRLGGAEALVRLIREDGTMPNTGDVIDALERKGYVSRLDFFILEQVCRFLRRCLDEGRCVYPISSNFSRVHLFGPNFPEQVAVLADKYRIPHHLLEIELTETVFLEGKALLQGVVRQLHRQGFQVSIDDFGSGYSSLNMLKDVEVDAIKLDREFLADFAANERAGTVIRHTLRLAQEMNITTVAEGIEDETQLLFLREMGCDMAQGYYFSRPLTQAAFLERYFVLP